MLKKTEIERLSTMLGWDISETKYAIQELIDSPTIVDSEGFLKICIKSDVPSDRWDKIVKFLLKTLKGDLVKNICDLLYIDPCFHALAFFNIQSFEKQLKQEWPEDNSLPLNEWAIFDGLWYPRKKKSFINWGPDIIDAIKTKNKLKRSRYILVSEINHYINSYDLSYKFLDILVYRKMAIGDIADLKELIDEVVSNVGLLAFNIHIFRRYLTVFYYNPYNKNFSKNALLELHSNFINPYLDRNQQTKLRYWLIYALVQTLKKEGCSEKRAIAKVGKLINLADASSVQPRYYERKKEAKKLNLSLEDIIRKYRLNLTLTEIMKGQY